MATVLDRPVSALNDLQNNIQQNSGRNSVEVIDVEEYYQANGSSSSSRGPISRPRPRPLTRTVSFIGPETISLVESDEDDEIRIISPIPNRSRQTRPLRSPPPPRQIPVVLMPPPVPAVPRRYSGMTSLPMTRNPPPFPAGPPVIPNPEPFDFEHDLSSEEMDLFDPGPVAGPSTLNANTHSRTAHRTVPRAAPRSHHTPSMGLGGALISSNNTRAQRELAHASRAATTVRRPVVSGARVGAARRLSHPVALDALLRGEDEEEPYIIRRLSGFDAFMRQYGQYIGFGESGSQTGTQGTDKAQYHQSYTHPPQPEPGFTFDFALAAEEDKPRNRLFPPTSVDAPIILDDDDGPSTSRVGPSSSATSAMKDSSSGEAGKLTALLVCARCLDPLLLNESLVGEEAQQRRVWALRCGHMIDEKCLNEIGQPFDDAHATGQMLTDPKGKGKAKAISKGTYSHALPELADTSAVGNTIRSRLRSSNSGSSAPSLAPTPAPMAPPNPKRRRTTKPKIEAEYEWNCPVESCRRVHASVKMSGIWGPEKVAKPPSKAPWGAASLVGWKDPILTSEPRGAIPVFA